MAGWKPALKGSDCVSKAMIEECEKELEKMKNIIPSDQMTTEDVNEVFPETK